MSGTLPLSSISLLGDLKKLYCGDNMISGSIGSEIGRMRKLEDLWLFENMFNSTLPTEVGNMRSLVYVRE